MATQTNKAMVSETSICNQALGWLGEKPINSLDEATVNAELCRENYPFLRDAVLAERMWTFAIARDKSTTGDMDAWEDQWQHAIPLEWLAVYRVFRDVSNGRRLESPGWQREGEFVLANQATIFMWGVKRITDTGKFSDMFVQCLAARIAADLCITITENQNQQGVLWQLYGAKLKEAAVRDGQQGSNETVKADKWIDARARGFTDGRVGLL